MADGDYYYVVTPINPFGEGMRGIESAKITIAGGGGTGKIYLTWDEVLGASSYAIPLPKRSFNCSYGF